jgi:glucokinase
MEILAFDIGGTQGRCCVASPGGERGEVRTLRRNSEENGRAWLDRLLAAGREVAQHSTALKVVAISFGGPIGNDGRIFSVHVRGWEDVDLRAEMQNAFKLPVVVDNDGNLGALGEFTFGAGRGCRTMLYFTVSTGIGGGAILDGKLYRGAHGISAEFGHIMLEAGPHAPQYASGKPGILEALASGPAIEREGRAVLKRLGIPIPEGFSAKHVFDAARGGEEWALSVRDKAMAQLGRGVAATICAFDPERVILGGGVALAGNVLFGPLREQAKKALPHYLEDKAEILQAELGDYSALMGAVALGKNAT